MPERQNHEISQAAERGIPDPIPVPFVGFELSLLTGEEQCCQQHIKRLRHFFGSRDVWKMPYTITFALLYS
jgi:hypothetical protein